MVRLAQWLDDRLEQATAARDWKSVMDGCMALSRKVLQECEEMKARQVARLSAQ